MQGDKKNLGIVLKWMQIESVLDTNEIKALVAAKIFLRLLTSPVHNVSPFMFWVVIAGCHLMGKCFLQQ